MRLWEPLADELGKGYLARLCSSNLLSEAQLAARLGVDDSSMRGFQLQLALLDRVLVELKMDRDTWVRRHSLVPACALVGRWRDTEHLHPMFGDSPYFAASLGAVGVARLCRQCVANDLERVGFAYWRRSHQLHGVTWCSEHRRPLGESFDPLAFEQSPDAMLESVSEVPGNDVDAAMGSEVLQRYAELLRRFLTLAVRPIALARAVQLIRQEASAQKLNSRGRLDARYLSYRAMFLPARWVEANVPRWTKSGKGCDWISDTAEIRMGPRKTESYAMALALLWKQPSHAASRFLFGV